MQIWYLISAKHLQGHLCFHGMVSGSLCTFKAFLLLPPCDNNYIQSQVVHLPCFALPQFPAFAYCWTLFQEYYQSYLPGKLLLIFKIHLKFHLC